MSELYNIQYVRDKVTRFELIDLFHFNSSIFQITIPIVLSLINKNISGIKFDKKCRIEKKNYVVVF